MTDPATVASTTPTTPDGDVGAFYPQTREDEPLEAPRREAEPIPAVKPAAALIEPDDAPAVLPTGNEVLDSLSHYDEVAILSAFRKPYSEMDEMTAVRALWFTLLRRAGQDDANARTTVLRAPWGDVKRNFRPADSDEDDADGEVSRPEV